MGPIIHLRINFCKKKKKEEEEEEEKEEAASPVRPAGKDREMIGCPSAHSEGRVTPTGTDPHPTSTFTQHHAGAPTRPGSISWDLDSHRGDAARTLSGGLWRQQGCSRHNHGQRHTHPQVSVALTAPRQRLGDVSARSPPPCVYQPSSKWEQGPVSALPPWSHRPPPLGRSKEKFLASSVLPKESAPASQFRGRGAQSWLGSPAQTRPKPRLNLPRRRLRWASRDKHTALVRTPHECLQTTAPPERHTTRLRKFQLVPLATTHSLWT